jgi:hypothetical protein
MKHYFVYIIFILGLAGCKSHEGEAIKDLDLANRTIYRISIADSSHKYVDIADSAGIKYFLGQLNSLSPHMEGNVYNEFYVTFYKGYDESDHSWHVTTLRMGKDCIGPMVSSSDVVKRWYFENDSLYNFINDKFHKGSKL